MDRAAAVSRERLHLLPRRLAQIEAGPGAMRELEQARAEAPGLVRRLPHQALGVERGQEAMQRRLGQSARDQEIGEAWRPRGFRNEVQHRDRLPEGLQRPRLARRVA